MTKYRDESRTASTDGLEGSYGVFANAIDRYLRNEIFRGMTYAYIPLEQLDSYSMDNHERTWHLIPVCASSNKRVTEPDFSTTRRRPFHRGWARSPHSCARWPSFTFKGGILYTAIVLISAREEGRNKTYRISHVLCRELIRPHRRWCLPWLLRRRDMQVETENKCENGAKPYPNWDTFQVVTSHG